jgi:hypothetical protein
MKSDSNDMQQQAEIDQLLWLAHKQSLAGPERAPFWRAGAWRCELHLSTGEAYLRVFKGDACVFEESTCPGVVAVRRANALRQFAQVD